MSRNPERKHIKKSIRFEVFKRDSFSCQYCGNSAPDAILELDHIMPIAKGGNNEITNLVTCCSECNQGKGAKTLNDDTTIKKQKKQLDRLQERRQQLEMLHRWKMGLANIEEAIVDECAKYWTRLTGYTLTDTGLTKLKKLTDRFGPKLIYEAMKRATSTYCKVDGNGQITHVSLETAFEKIGGCARLMEIDDDGHLRRLYYIRGICRNVLSYYDGKMCGKYLKEAYAAGAPLDWLEEHAKSSRTYSTWRRELQSKIWEDD